MLDMLDGMHEFFTQAAYHSSLANTFEILPSKEKTKEEQNTATNTDRSHGSGAVIISFSEARARRIMQQDALAKERITQRALNKL